MEDITIKSITHCPTCNSECKVNAGTTQYYVPVKKYTEEDMKKAFDSGYDIRSSYGDRDDNMTAEQYINSLNKQD
jgi:hypothetical protein